MEKLIVNITTEDTVTDINPSWVDASEISYINFRIADSETTVKANVFFFMAERMREMHSCESHLIEAVRNLSRKINLLELNMALDNEEIGEEEYEKEIDENEGKYIITLNDNPRFDSFLCISQLMHKIGHDVRDYTISEVSEMFSIKESALLSHSKVIKHQLK